LLVWDIGTVGTSVFVAFWIGSCDIGDGDYVLFCGERNKAYDEQEAKIGCLMKSIAGWLVKVKIDISIEEIFGAPRGIRTPDTLFRRQMLYPLSYGCFSGIVSSVSIQEKSKIREVFSANVW
jgi:hypothetical protein